MTFQNGGSHRKLFLDRRKRSQFDHTVVRKAMLIYYAYVTSSGYINRFKKNAAFQEIHVFDHIFLVIVPLFRTLPGALLLAKLQHQLTIFFASPTPFCSVTLVRAIFKRHPEVPHCRDRRKKSPSVSAAIFAGDQIRCDRRIKSPGVSPA